MPNQADPFNANGEYRTMPFDISSYPLAEPGALNPSRPQPSDTCAVFVLVSHCPSCDFGEFWTPIYFGTFDDCKIAYRRIAGESWDYDPIARED